MVFLYVILGVVLAVYFYLTWNFDYWAKLGVPSTKARILLGDLPNTLLRRKHVAYDFEKLYA